jgi:hypothetical protein
VGGDPVTMGGLDVCLGYLPRRISSITTGDSHDGDGSD